MYAFHTMAKICLYIRRPACLQKRNKNNYNSKVHYSLLLQFTIADVHIVLSPQTPAPR